MRPERFARLRAALRRRQPDLTVLMERVHKAHNLSAILRNCDAAGVLEAHAVPPEEGLSLSQHTSAGTAKWVKLHRHVDTDAAVDALHEQGLTVVAAHPDPEAADFRDIDYTRPTAIMMGSELRGLSERGIERADRLIVIPMMGMAASLNVSVATALILFEAQRQRAAAGMYDHSRIPDPDFETRLFEWAYPRLSRRFRAEGRPYPELDENGQLILG